ncbi:hypothetical protein [Luteibacter rhizovicinus]|nr:hypothetical protein [Luteibacter rhizovicinus]
MKITMVISTAIEQDCGLVFDLLTDLRQYGLWLRRSGVFRGTTAIAPGPIGVGTTYVESSLWGTRHGIINALERPALVSYRQPMALRPRWLGTVDVRINDTLATVEGVTLLTRSIRLTFFGPVRFIKQAVALAFQREIVRTQSALKEYAESLAPSTPRNM